VSVPLVRPFAAIRPAPGKAAVVAAPPYDVLTTEEARARAAGNPASFLHVSKPEIDLPVGADAMSDDAYATAARNMQRMLAEGVLVRDAAPGFYVYRLTREGHVQTGVAAAASMAAYENGRVRRHELTRPDKEHDRARQIDAVNAHTGPVFATHRADDRVAAGIAAVTAGPPAMQAEVDGTSHEVWTVDDPAAVTEMAAAFEAMPAIYIADGHHRSAAAARVAEWRRAAGAGAGDGHEWFLVVSFPADEVAILDYNRVVRDLNGLDPAVFLDAITDAFHVAPATEPVRPDAPGVFGLFVDGGWHRLQVRTPPPADVPPVARLDITVLTERLLAPVLAIGDPRTDPRIDFVGGGRGLGELERRVRSGDWAVAFSLYPTSLADLMAVADAGQVMPPKSTWFEPKLADGLLSLPID